MTVPFSQASLADTLTNRPAADPAKIGRFFFATDTGILYRDNGTTWDACSTADTYKSYIGIFHQNGEEEAPTVTILHNTIGNIVWTRFDAGYYHGTLTGAFPANKTWTFPRGQTFIDEGAGILMRESNDMVFVKLFSDTQGSSMLDGVSYMPIEIRVYP